MKEDWKNQSVGARQANEENLVTCEYTLSLSINSNKFQKCRLRSLTHGILSYTFYIMNNTISKFQNILKTDII